MAENRDVGLDSQEREGIMGVSPEERRAIAAQEAGMIAITPEVLETVRDLNQSREVEVPIEGGFIGVPSPLDPRHPDTDRIIGTA